MQNHLFLITFSLLIITHTTMFAQEIIQLPITKEDANISWDKAESNYYSKIWDTQVVSNVSKPSMEVFRPVQGTENGTAIVICPGGALYAHSITSEGDQVAQWLAKKGVTAFVLKYRLVPTGEDATQDVEDDGKMVIPKAKKMLPLAVSDGLHAMEYVRANAATYGIKEDRIGIMGFSAGGAVTMGVALNYKTKNKPNFIAPIYAWTAVMDAYEVPTDAPPAFVLCASDDELDLAAGNVDIYSAWLKAGKSAELHMYSTGGHGFGMRTKNLPSDNWIELLSDWLEVQGFMKE